MANLCPVIGPDGREYPSQAAACRKFGISRTTLQYHLNTHGDLSRFGMGKRRRNCQNAAKELTIGTLTWPSRVAAARDLGVSESQIKRWISPKATPVMKDMLAAAVMRYISERDRAAYRERAARDVMPGKPRIKQ